MNSQKFLGFEKTRGAIQIFKYYSLFLLMAFTLSASLTACNGSNFKSLLSEANRYPQLLVLSMLKNTTAPIGYSVTFDQTIIYSGNENAVSFTINGVEPGPNYNYTITSSGPGAPITGSGVVPPATTTIKITGINVTGLSDGTLTVSVTLTDAAGKTGNPATSTRTKDTVNPVVGFISPIVNERVNGTKVISFSDSDLNAPQLSVDNTVWTNATSGSTTMNDITGFGALLEGSFTLYLRDTDAAGNTSVPLSVSIIKDTTAPISSLSGQPTGQNSAASLNVTVDGGDVQFYQYKVGVSGSTDCTSGTGYSGNISSATLITDTISGLPDGGITLCVVGRDTAGNLQSYSSATSATWTKDSSVPTATISGEPTLTNNATVLNVDVAGTDIQNYKYKVGATASTDCSNSSGYSGSISAATNITNNISGLSDGSITLCVVGQNSASTWQPYSAATSATWTKDTIAPTVAITSPTAGAKVNGSKTISFTDNELGAPQISVDNTNWTSVVSGITTLSNIPQFAGLGQGAFTLYLRDIDAATNTGTNSISVTKDTVAPSGYSASIDQSFIYSANINAISFTFSGAEVGSTYNYSITSSGGGTAVTDSGTIASASQQITGISVAGLSDGTLTLSITLTDTAGNTGTAATDTKTKDTLAPSDQDSVFATSITTGPNKSVTIVSSGDASNQVWFAPFGTTTFSAGATMTTAFGTATSIQSPTTSGDYRLYIIDQYGNVSSPSLATLTVDADPPTNQNAVFPSDVTDVGGATIAINSSGDSTNTVWFAPLGTTNFVANGSTITSASGTSTSITAPTTAGGATYKLYVIDQYGNVSNPSTATLTVDNSSIVAIISGAPSNPSKVTTLNVTVSGSIDFYQYKVGAAGSTDCSSASGYSIDIAPSTHITNDISGISDGLIRLCVIGKRASSYQAYASASTATWTKDTAAPTNQNTVFATSAISQGGLAIAIVSSGDATNQVWFAPVGTTTFTASATMTMAASGTSTTINAPANDGAYYIYIIDAAGNVSAHSTASLTVDNIAPTNQNTVFPTSVYKHGGNSVSIGTTTEAEIWFAPAGLTSYSEFIEGATITKAAGSAGSILAPANEGNYRLYVIDAAHNVSNASVAILSVDNTNPVISSISPASSATVSNKNVSYTLSETCASGSITWTETGGGDDPAGSPAVHTYTMSGSDLNSGAHNLTLSSLSLFSTTIYSVQFSATDAAGNNGTATSTNVTYNTGATTLTITSAETMDADNDGKIDHYKITFNDSVNDSTFPGYVLNSLGTAQTAWTIAGYSGVVLAHGSAAPEADTPNNNVIYLKFTEGAGYDTGAKPDLTTSATPGLKSSSNVALAQVNTPDVTEADVAKPIVVGASGTTTYTGLTVAFSEAVWGTTNKLPCTSGASGDMVSATLSYLDGNAAGATGLSLTMGSDACASDSGFNATYTVNSAFVTGDTADSVHASANVYDAADNAGEISISKNLNIVAATVPLITKIETFDSNNNGKIDQLKITFNQNMDDSTISKASAAQFTINSVAASDVDSVTGGTSTISSPNNDPGIGNDSVVTVFTDDTSVTGTGALPIAFTKVSGKWRASGGAELESVSDLSAFIVDKAPPVLMSAVAHENTIVGTTADIDSDDTIVLTFSEPTNKPIFNTATVSTGVNLDSVFQLTTGHTWGSRDAITSAVWNGAGDKLTVTFSGGGTTPATLTPGDSIVIIGTSLADTAPIPNISTNIAAREPISGSFVTDTYPPYMLTVYNIRSNSITVQYSKPMLCDGTGNAINTIANYTVKQDPYGTPTTLSVTSIDIVSSSAVQLNFSTTLANLVLHNVAIASGHTVVDQASPTPNQISRPTNLDFIVNEQLKVVYATPITQNSVRIYLNKIPKAGNDVTGSAGCTTATECNKRYKINPSLGNITQAIVGTGVMANTVTITHTTAQTGIAYTVIAANGMTGDGFDNLSNESIRNVDDTENVQAIPKDRAGFTGLGNPVVTLDDGSFFWDPFVDGTAFSYTFTYGSRVYLGTNDTNKIAYRFDPGGTNAMTATFDFSTAGGTFTCSSADGFGYGPASTCGVNMGYYGEKGVGGFTAGNMTIGGSNYEMLLIGPLKTVINIAYFTQDIDTILNWKQFPIFSTTGANAEAIHTIYGIDNHLYVALSCSHQNFAPQVGYHVVTQSGGVISIGAATDMNMYNLANIGKKASPANPAKANNSSAIVGIDSIVKYNNYLYMANNGGIVYSSNAGTPVFDQNFATYAVTATPSGWTGVTLVLSTLSKINPGSKGVPIMKEYNGKLYVVRNVSLSGASQTTQLRGEFWVCNPSTSGNTQACDPGDWTKLVSGTETDLGSGSNSFSMFEINGEYAYLGVDNPTTGGRVFRMKATNSSHVPIDVPATNGSTMTSAGWAAFVVLDSTYPNILSSTTISDGTSDFIYITSGKFGYTTPAIKIFRQKD